MAITEAYTGSETIGTTEWSCTTDTAGPDADTNAGTYALVVDTSAVAAGSIFEARFYRKVRAADTQRMVWSSTFGAGAGFVTPWLPGRHGWDFTLVKLTGTDAAMTWSIEKYA